MLVCHAQQPTGGHRLIGTLDLNQFRITEHRETINQSRGGRAEHHPTGRSDRLHPLSHPDLLTNGRVSKRPRTDVTGYHLTGVQTQAQTEVQTVTMLDLSRNPVGLLLNVYCGHAGAESVVLQRHRRTEYRHDPVTGELVHRAAVALNHRSTTLDQLGHDLAQPLRTNGCCDVHRMHHVGEQDGDLLVLRAGISVLDRGATPVTESRTLTQLGATRTARGRCGHPTLRRFRPPSFPIHQHKARDDAKKEFDHVAVNSASPHLKGTYRWCAPLCQHRHP